jgi:hypothetical protein
LSQQEDIMDIRRMGRMLACATVAAVALATVDYTPAVAGGGGSIGKAPGIEQGGGDEVSARKRHRRHYSHRGNRAALHAFGAIAGTIGGIIAANEARRAYRRYYYDPYYAAPYPGYYPYSHGYVDPYW